MKGYVQENFVEDEHGYKTKYYGNVLTGSGVRTGESGKPWRGFDPSAKARHWAIPGAIVERSRFLSSRLKASKPGWESELEQSKLSRL